MSATSPSGKYFLIQASHCAVATSFLHCGSVGSLTYAEEITPTDFCKPAGCMTALTEVALYGMNCSGFQPMSNVFRMACAANFGEAKMNSVSAPEPLRLA